MNNRQPFLDMIAMSELGPRLLAISDNGYNVLVGGTLFTSYADHPRQHIQVRPGLWSTAAGRYQILERTYDAYKELLGLEDFSPVSQDAIAMQMIRETGALPLIDAGDLVAAIAHVAHLWASLPNAGYNQHQNKYAVLQADFVTAGGKLLEMT